jgi:hypothetical protein
VSFLAPPGAVYIKTYTKIRIIINQIIPITVPGIGPAVLGGVDNVAGACFSIFDIIARDVNIYQNPIKISLDDENTGAHML